MPLLDWLRAIAVFFLQLFYYLPLNVLGLIRGFLFFIFGVGSLLWFWVQREGLFSAGFYPWLKDKLRTVWSFTLEPLSVAALAFFRAVEQLVVVVVRGAARLLLLAFDFLLFRFLGFFAFAAPAFVSVLRRVADGRLSLQEIAWSVEWRVHFVEQAAFDTFKALRDRLNVLILWTNHALQSEGVFREGVMAWSAFTWQGAVIGALLNASVSDNALARGKQLAEKLGVPSLLASLLGLRDGRTAQQPEFLAALARFRAGQLGGS